jgi:hypothetical protein
MSWIIACFCGHLIDTPTCPHCGSRLPDLTGRQPAPPGADNQASRVIRNEAA